jgi:hypothetical protein
MDHHSLTLIQRAIGLAASHQLRAKSSRIDQGNVDFSSRLRSLARRAQSDAAIRSLPIYIQL